MNAYRDFYQAQQILNELLTIGHMLDQGALTQLKNELNYHVNHMVANINPLPIVQPMQANNNYLPNNIEQEAIHLENLVIENQNIVRPRRMARNNNNANTEKSKVISKKKLQESCPEECAICQDIPKYKDAVFTDCSHYYCKTCWQGWMNAPTSSKNCPMCRNNMPGITCYKERAARQRQRQLIIEL